MIIIFTHERYNKYIIKKECEYMYLVIDIGSNTIRAVVFRVESGSLVPVLNKKYSAGLAGYIENNGALSREGIEVAVEVLSEIRIIIDALEFDGVFPFATASLRNISNSKLVLEEIKHRCGLSIPVLSGKEEAFFDYYGAVSDAGTQEGILIDVGGGSSEIVIFRDGKSLAVESLQAGSLNMYHRHVSGLIPTAEEIKKIEEDTRKLLQSCGKNLKEAAPEKGLNICAVGGTARAALKLHNSIYHLNKKNHIYERCFLKRVLSSGWKEDQLMRLILKTAPERIHTLLPGIAIFYTVAKYFGSKKIITSSHGVREGYLYYQLEKAGIIK